MSHKQDYTKYSVPGRQDVQGSRGALTVVALIIKETKAMHIKIGNLETLYKTRKIDAFNTVPEKQQ